MRNERRGGGIETTERQAHDVIERPPAMMKEMTVMITSNPWTDPGRESRPDVAVQL